MQLIPEILLDHTHILPSIHPIGLNISYFLLVFSLLMLITLHIDLQIGFLRTLDYYLSYFLGCFYFVYAHFALEALGNDV
jgi:hypothetical protein